MQEDFGYTFLYTRGFDQEILSWIELIKKKVKEKDPKSFCIDPDLFSHVSTPDNFWDRIVKRIEMSFGSKLRKWNRDWIQDSQNGRFTIKSLLLGEDE